MPARAPCLVAFCQDAKDTNQAHDEKMKEWAEFASETALPNKLESPDNDLSIEDSLINCLAPNVAHHVTYQDTFDCDRKTTRLEQRIRRPDDI